MSVLHTCIKGAGKPLVLFHGWGFDTHIWSSLLPLLIPHYQLYLVDLPGFGLSPTMPWTMFKSALLTKLPATFALLGWSMGGLMATRLTLEEPQRITHLINVASSPYFIREKSWPGIHMKVLNAFYEDLALHPEKTLTSFIQLQLQGQTIPLGSPPSLSGLREGLDILVNYDLREGLYRLHQPVCYMFGHLDGIVPRMIRDTLEKMHPHFRYVLFPKAAHAPFLSDPKAFVAVLRQFLR